MVWHFYDIPWIYYTIMRYTFYSDSEHQLRVQSITFKKTVVSLFIVSINNLYHGTGNWKRIWWSRRTWRNVCEADLFGWSRIYSQAGTCIDFGNDQRWIMKLLGLDLIELETINVSQQCLAVLVSLLKMRQMKSILEKYRKFKKFYQKRFNYIAFFRSHVLQKVCMYFTYKVRQVSARLYCDFV